MRILVVAIELLSFGLAGAVHAEPQTGIVRGKVSVLKKKFFGGLEKSDDASGVVVYVTGYTEAGPSHEAVLEQENERFQPRVLPIVAGQSVTFPNRDRFYHNVFSVSPVEPFDLGQYKSSDPPRAQVFAKAGLVPVYCNIRSQRISHVVVLENPAFTVTGEDGTFELRGVRDRRECVDAGCAARVAGRGARARCGSQRRARAGADADHAASHPRGRYAVSAAAALR